MRTRREESANYSSVFLNGKTLRIPIDSDKPITELRYPEFYDISLGNKCNTGRCNYCYASGNPHGVRYENIVDKAKKYFGEMSLNQRPYQTAIGGESEPLEHPDFWDFCKTLLDLGIVPNFTTNGVLVSDKIIPKIKELCGGVAITYHEHLEKFFFRGLDILIKHGIKTNIHFIISDKKSIALFADLYEQYQSKIDYFVLLPYMNVGFAADNPKTIDYDYLEKVLDDIYTNGDIAFGANFYEFLKERGQKYDVSLYPPEIMSKYLIMNDDMKIYNNSFDCKEVDMEKI
jgi:MoaA/NifB/PqqE/SkfB family radical SAM enzyme